MTSPREEFENCLIAPLQQHLGVPFPDERSRLDALNPAVLCAKIAQGVESARSRWAGVLSPGSQQLLTEFLNKSRREAEPGAALWAALNEHTNSAFFSGLIAGVASEETATGAAVGSLFGPLGTVVGAAIGGMVAGNKIDDRGKQIAQQFTSWHESWLSSLGTFADHQLMPSVASDFQRPAGGLAGGSALKVLAIAAATLAIAAGAHLAWSRGSSSPPSALAPTASTTATTSPMAALAGRWRSTAGDELDASVVGANARFAPVLVDSKSPWSAWGPGALFTLSASADGPTSFDVEAAVVPSLPPGFKADPPAIERCRELWHDLRGKPLRATLERNTLTVDIVKLDIAPGGLDVQGGKVVGCKKLDPSRAVKTQVTLTR